MCASASAPIRALVIRSSIPAAVTAARVSRKTCAPWSKPPAPMATPRASSLPWMPAAAASIPTSPSPSPTVPRPQTSIRTRSSRSRRGLYDGKDVRFGNNVPFSMKKTRRRWNPNVQKKRVYSEVLDEMVRFHLTTSALRSIDKMGGLDNYLLKSKHVSTKG